MRNEKKSLMASKIFFSLLLLLLMLYTSRASRVCFWERYWGDSAQQHHDSERRKIIYFVQTEKNRNGNMQQNEVRNEYFVFVLLKSHKWKEKREEKIESVIRNFLDPKFIRFFLWGRKTSWFGLTIIISFCRVFFCLYRFYVSYFLFSAKFCFKTQRLLMLQNSTKDENKDISYKNNGARNKRLVDFIYVLRNFIEA